MNNDYQAVGSTFSARTAALPSSRHLMGKSTQGARVIEDINTKLEDIFAIPRSTTRRVEIDVRGYALSEASVEAVLQTYRDSGFVAIYSDHPHLNGQNLIGLAW